MAANTVMDEVTISRFSVITEGSCRTNYQAILSCEDIR